MDGFDPRTSFGYDESQRYDATDTRGDEAETVAFLARLAAGRDALEFAIGTGRIALPLTDLMARLARLAGLRLRDRWGGWNGEPFTPASWRHISVYQQ